MSDDEEEVSSSEEESSEEEQEEKVDAGEKQAQEAMQKRREIPTNVKGLTDENKEMLELNVVERTRMEDEIEEMRKRSDRRKKEIQEENKRLQQLRIEEDARRKAEEEDRRRKKDDDEKERREARAQKMAEFEKWKNPPKPNFVITKKAGGEVEVESDEPSTHEVKKSKEQLEAEKRATLAQRVPHIDVKSIESSKLSEKAKELYNLVCRLEGEKYDLEKRYKTQQIDMIELADRARNMTKGGKSGTSKKLNPASDEVDKIQERHAGAPVKVEMFSKYERQKDKRTYQDRHVIFTGPQYGYPADRIKPKRVLEWDDQGQPIYVGGESNAQENGEE